MEIKVITVISQAGEPTFSFSRCFSAPSSFHRLSHAVLCKWLRASGLFHFFLIGFSVQLCSVRAWKPLPMEPWTVCTRLLPLPWTPTVNLSASLGIE